MALSVVGFGLQVLALRGAPLSLVQPVLALGLVLLLVLGRVVLGERAGRRDVLGAAGVIAGVTLLVLAAPERGGDGNRTALAIACVVLAVLAVAPFALRAQQAPPLIAATACADALAALAINEVSVAISPLEAVALAWAALAAAAGLAALASEAAALQRATVAAVGPAVLAGQVAIPVVLAPLVAGDRWDRVWLVVLGPGRDGGLDDGAGRLGRRRAHPSRGLTRPPRGRGRPPRAGRAPTARDAAPPARGSGRRAARRAWRRRRPGRSAGRRGCWPGCGRAPSRRRSAGSRSSAPRAR